jgi:hypothetical protein
MMWPSTDTAILDGDVTVLLIFVRAVAISFDGRTAGTYDP